MPILFKLLRGCVKVLLSAVVGAAFLAFLHRLNWYPDEQIAGLLVTAPTLAQLWTAFLGLTALFAFVLLFAEHWISPFMARIIKGKSPNNPFTSKWPLAPAVIDYIADSLGISQQEACFALKQRLQEGSIKAQGPINSANAIEIEKEFWRFALPTPEGEARNFSTFVRLPWFEVRAEDVLAIWPMK